MAGNKVPLAELCELVVDCPHSTPLWTENGKVVLRSQNIKNGCLDLTTPSYTDEKHFEERVRRAKPRGGDLVITREAPMGEICMIPDGVECCLGQRMVLLRPDTRKVDSRYLLFAIQSKEVQHEIHVNEGTGSTVSNLRIPLLEKLPIPCCSLTEQRFVANCLGTLNDKIELNRKMNETLEAMARALFKSWFVDFDPVHAKAAGRHTGLPKHIADLFPNSFVDSKLGWVPKGWTVGAIGDVAIHPRRGLQPSEIEPNTPYIALEHMPRRCIALSEWGVADSLESNKFAFKRGEILFGKLRPYFHKVGIAPIDGVCSTDIVVVAPKTAEWFGFALGHLSSTELVEFTNAGSTGTKMPRTSWDEMARYEVALPNSKLAEKFTEIVKTITERIVKNIYESREISAIRDALLPKLIAGEIRIL